jgi:hypothetical protein
MMMQDARMTMEDAGIAIDEVGIASEDFSEEIRSDLLYLVSTT